MFLAQNAGGAGKEKERIVEIYSGSKYYGLSNREVSLFEFLALRGCRLGELAGDRNSQLGRVMVPSRQLIY